MAFRGTFVVNTEGQIKIAEIHDNGIGRTASELMRKVEAALDLAGICNKVILLDFLDELRADNVLREKVCQTPDIEIYTASQSLEITGNYEKVTGILLKNRRSNEERMLPLDGVFVQIGFSPNSALLSELVMCNPRGEIVIDEACRTSAQGVYAAGDVSSVPYKQIVIAMGEGPKRLFRCLTIRLEILHPNKRLQPILYTRISGYRYFF